MVGVVRRAVGAVLGCCVLGHAHGTQTCKQKEEDTFGVSALTVHYY